MSGHGTQCITDSPHILSFCTSRKEPEKPFKFLHNYKLIVAKARVSRAQIGQAPSKNTVSGYCVIVGLFMLSSR